VWVGLSIGLFFGGTAAKINTCTVHYKSCHAMMCVPCGPYGLECICAKKVLNAAESFPNRGPTSSAHVRRAYTMACFQARMRPPQSGQRCGLTTGDQLLRVSTLLNLMPERVRLLRAVGRGHPGQQGVFMCKSHVNSIQLDAPNNSQLISNKTEIQHLCV
jgi:hypothetical protein